MAWLQFIMDLCEKYRTTWFITSKAASIIYRVFISIIFIFMFIGIPAFAVSGLYVYCICFWTSGILNYTLMAIADGSPMYLFQVAIIIFFFFSLGYYFWCAWACWAVSFSFTTIITSLEYIDSVDAYLRAVKWNLKEQEFLHQEYLDSKTWAFPKTSKGLRQKRGFRIRYESYNPYKVSIYDVIPSYGYYYFRDYYLDGEELYYRYARFHMNLPFYSYFKLLVRYLTFGKASDWFIDFLFRLFAGFLPSIVMHRLRYWTIIRIYLYFTFNGLPKVMNSMYILILLYPFSIYLLDFSFFFRLFTA